MGQKTFFPTYGAHLRRSVLGTCLLLCILSSAWFLITRFRPANTQTHDTKGRVSSGGQTWHVRPEFVTLPLSFEPNVGQASPHTRFLARGDGYALHLTGNEFFFLMRHPGRARRYYARPGFSQSRTPEAVRSNLTILRMNLAGANLTPLIYGLEELPGKTNYFIGNDPQKWFTNITTYERVRYENVYPGVDLIFHGNQGKLEYDFVVAAGARPEGIALELHGMNHISLNSSGDLVARLEGGEVLFYKPRAYQEKGTERLPVAVRFVRREARVVGFAVGAHDQTLPLVIDPVMSFSTYLGGTDSDQGNGIAVDTAGDVYVTGTTISADFPTTTGAFSKTFNTTTCLTSSGSRPCSDVFVSKLDPTGSSLLYSTYIGGSGDDVGARIAVDGTGNAYITGATASTDFPAVAAFQSANAGGTDAFVAKLNSTGSALLYSTYLGGAGADQGSGIAVDSAGNAYLTGSTTSSNFPTTAGAFQTTEMGSQDAFVTKLNPTGSSLAYSTLLGGKLSDLGSGIAVDSLGNAYVTGLTGSADFPTVAPLQTSNAGFGDAFVTKVSADGSALVYSTFLGGTKTDQGQDIAVDSAGNAYITGFTNSTDFPTASPFQSANAGGTDAFVAELNTAGAKLVFATYLGGTGSDVGNGIAVDASGKVYVTGQTSSSNFPTASPFRAALQFADAFVTVFTSAGSALSYSSFLGGTGSDAGNAVAVDSSGNAYVTGSTNSTDFPTTVGSFQMSFPTPSGGPTNAGGTRPFVAKIAPTDAPGVSLSKTSLSFVDQSVTTTSAPQAVTLRNVGSALLTISSISIDVADFGQTNDCISGVAGGTDCVIRVTFSPTSRGQKNGTLSITDNASGNPHSIKLSGNGIAPAVTLSTSSLTFTAQNIGTASSPQPVTLTNSGVDPLTIGGIAVNGDYTQTNNCGTSVAAGANCTINVTFTPTAALTRNGTVVIADNAPGNPHQVQLSGTGVGPGVTLSKTSLSFSEQPVGTTSGAQTFTLTNSGNAQLVISGVNVTGDFGQTNDCGATLDAGKTCTFNVTFVPKSAGTTFGEVTIADNAPGNPHGVILSGTAVAGPAPEAFLSTTNLSVGSQPVNTTTSPQIVTLSNTGNADLMITSVDVTGDFSQTNNCGASRAAGTQCAFTITFTPTGAGIRTGTLTIKDNATGSPQSVALSGVGTDFGMSGSPASAAVTGGKTATYTLTLTPVAGFDRAVSLNCTGAPQASTCTIVPSNLTLDGSNSATAKITVTTTALSGNNPPSPPTRVGPPAAKMRVWFLRVISLLALGLFPLISAARRLPRHRRLALAGALAALLCGACVVGSRRVTGTIPGNYLLTISATATTSNGSMGHKINLGLTVN